MKRYLEVIKKYPSFMDACNQTIKENSLNDRQQLYLLTFAPAVIAFVDYALTDSSNKGINKLYFLSRDGYQMYLAAKRIAELKEIKTDCRYINVSRFSMRVPGYRFDIDKAIESICTSGIDVTIPVILKRAALSDEECDTVIAELGLTCEKDRILSYSDVVRLSDELKKSERLRSFIETHSDAAYDNAVGYLKQEGLLEGDYSLVDSGWIGTLQLSMERILNSCGYDRKLTGYYFGMYEYPTSVNKNKDLRRNFNTFYFSPSRGLRIKSRFSNSLFEAVITSPEKMTVGYKKTGDGFSPVYKNSGIDEVKDDSREFSVDGDIYALKAILTHLSDIPNFESEDIRKLLNYLMSEPGIKELEAFGNEYFSDDILENTVRKTAADLTEDMIHDQRFLRKLLITGGIIKREIRESAWIEGSAVRNVLNKFNNKDREFVRKETERELRHIRFTKAMIFLRKQLRNL